MPTISLKLSTDSIEQAIRELKSYEKKVEENTQEIKKETAERVQSEAEYGFNGAIYDDIIHEGMKVPNVTVQTNDDGSSVFTTDEQAVFVEFGAGVYYNPSGSAHPVKPPWLSAIGTYGHGYGSRKVWGFKNKAGETVLTHGTPASMPMYHAAENVAKEVPEIAKKVFKG